MTDVAGSLIKRLVTQCKLFDQRPALKNLLFDCSLSYKPETHTWERTGDVNCVAELAQKNESLTTCVQREFRYLEPQKMNVGFKQLSFLQAALEVGAKLPQATLPSSDGIPTITIIDSKKELPDIFLLITHPLACWHEAVTNQSVTLVFKAHKRYKAINLNQPFCTVNDLQMERSSPQLHLLQSSPVRIGGYFKRRGLAPLICLHPYEVIDGAQVVGPLAMSGNVDAIAAVIADEGHPAKASDFMFFLGYHEWSHEYVKGLLQFGHAVAAEVPELPDLEMILSFKNEPIGPDRAGRAREMSYIEWQRACIAAGEPFDRWALFPARDTLPENLIDDYLDKISSTL